MADIFDAFNDHPERKERCPRCEGGDVKFATHEPGRYAFTLSARCADCKLTETGNDHAALFLRWSH